MDLNKTALTEWSGGIVPKVILTVLLIGLYGTMTNNVLISPIPSLCAFILIIPVLIFRYKRPVPGFLFWLYLFFLLAIVSTLIYYPSSFLSYDFYRYDGNFIISYMPLMIFPFFRFKVDIEKRVKEFCYSAIVVNTVFYILILVKTGGGCFTNPAAEGNVFNPFFQATNAGGGFYSILASIVLAFYLREKKGRYIFLFFLCILFLWGTTSRGSILGLFFGVTFYFLNKKGKKLLIILSIAAILFIQVLILYNTYPYYKAYLIDSGDLSTDARLYLSDTYGDQSSKESNIYIRAFDTWPRGLALFFNSPIVGSGFGSVNDVPLNLKTGIPGIVSFNASKNHLFNDSHAHHSYLHFLAELGITGLAIFLFFWIKLFRFINFRSTKIPEPIKVFLIIAMYNLAIMSFTEHRITTPSNVLPFIIILCLCIINHNYEASLSKAEINY